MMGCDVFSVSGSQLANVGGSRQQAGWQGKLTGSNCPRFLVKSIWSKERRLLAPSVCSNRAWSITFPQPFYDGLYSTSSRPLRSSANARKVQRSPCTMTTQPDTSSRKSLSKLGTILDSRVGVPLPILDQYLLEELFQPLLYGLLAFSSLAVSIGEYSDPSLLRLLRRGLFLGHALKTHFLPHKQSTCVLIARGGKINVRICYW
jgi:hypothetical protein